VSIKQVINRYNMNNIDAVLFGSIGTIMETSRLQYNAFLKAFEEAGLEWHWPESDYKEMLNTPGGLNRISEYAKSRGESVDATALYGRKNELFHASLKNAPPSLRTGVADLLQHCRNNDIKLAFVSTTQRSTLDTMFDSIPGLNISDFDFVGDGSLVTEGKPSPEIYQLAVKSLGIGPDLSKAIAIEDSPPSLKAATAAGLRCLYFPGEFISERPADAELVTDLSILTTNDSGQQ